MEVGFWHRFLFSLLFSSFFPETAPLKPYCKHSTCPGALELGPRGSALGRGHSSAISRQMEVSVARGSDSTLWVFYNYIFCSYRVVRIGQGAAWRDRRLRRSGNSQPQWEVTGAEQRSLHRDGRLRMDLQDVQDLKIYMTWAEERSCREMPKCPGREPSWLVSPVTTIL